MHFATCEVAGKLWSDLLSLAGKEELRDDREKERLALFALLPGEQLEDGWVLMSHPFLAAIVGGANFNANNMNVRSPFLPMCESKSQRVEHPSSRMHS